MVSRTRHTWTEDDDIALLVAIDDVGGLAEHYERQGYARVHWWDAVAGALHKRRPTTVVTGSACRARWARIDSEDRDRPDLIDGWARAERVVAEWEERERQALAIAIGNAVHHARELGYEFVLAFLAAAERRMCGSRP